MRKISLFMLMAVGLLISGNLRADNVCKIVNGQEYATLQEAFDAVPTDGTETTIEMIADVVVTGQSAGYRYAVLKEQGQKAVLDLAGHTISVEVSNASNANCIRVEGNTTLTIRDSKKGGLMKLQDNASAAWTYSSAVIWNQGTLTIDVDKNTKFWNSTTVNGIDYVIDNQIESGRAYPVNCTINGGTYQCDANPIMRLYEQHGEYIVKVTIEDGEFIGQRCFLFQKCLTAEQNSQIELNIKGGTYIARQNDKDYRFIDSQFDYATSSLKKVTVNIGNKEGEKQPNITGFLYLAGGGSNATYTNYQERGLETINIYGGIFNTSNPIQIPNGVGSEQEVFEYVKNNNLWKIYGGQFVFDEKPYEFKVIDAIQLEQHDDKGDYAVDPTGYYKHYGMATAQNWIDLGYYLVENKNTGKDGTWYSVMKMKSGSDAYDNFKNLIVMTEAGVKETVQGTVRNVQVIPVHGAEQPIKTETTWPETDAGSQVVLEGSGAVVTIPADQTVEAYSVTVPTGSTLNVEAGATLIVGAGGVTTATGEETISINIGSNNGSGAIKISPDADESVAKPRVRVRLTTKAHAEGEGVDQVYHWQYFARPTGMNPETFKVVYNPELGGATKHFIYGYNGVSNNYSPITDLTNLGNYQGYAITNDSKEGGVVYQFEGILNPNADATLKFENSNFTLLGNSYLAPVSMAGLFTGILESQQTPTTAPVANKAALADNGNIEYTIWIYDHDQRRFVQTNQIQANLRKQTAQLQPMQGFFMRLMEGSSLTTKIDYVGAVWNNNAQAGPILAPAHDYNGMGIASIVVSANGCADQIDLFEDAEFDNSFNNGADASKLMNLQGMFNLYAQTEAGTLSCVASDNIEGTILTFQANTASEYELSFNDVANMNYSLIDLANGEIIEMNEGNVYKFNAIPNSTEARFQIVEGYKAPTAMEKVNNVKAAKGIYSVTGANLGDVKNFNALPAGIYIVNGQQIVK